MNMDKNEILERSRKENQGADLVELEVGRKSSGIAGAASLCIGAVLNLISTCFFDTPMHLFWVMFFSYSAAQGISRLILDKRRGRKTQGVWIFYGWSGSDQLKNVGLVLSYSGTTITYIDGNGKDEKDVVTIRQMDITDPYFICFYTPWP